RNIGIDPLVLLGGAEDPASGALALTSTKATVTKAGSHSELVTTEGSARQHGRGIAQAMLAAELAGAPSAPQVGGGDGASSATAPQQAGDRGGGNVRPDEQTAGDTGTSQGEHGAGAAGAAAAAGAHGGGHD